MKLSIQLQGKFHRTLMKGEDTQPVSLKELLREVQTVATQYNRNTPQQLQKSFGLDFIPESVFIQLLKQANDVTQEDDLYQIPALKRLHPLSPSLSPQVANTYTYQFKSPEANLNLTPDDPQLPPWQSQDEQLGTYRLILDSPQHSDITAEFSENIWQSASLAWENLPTTQKIKYFLNSLVFQEANIPLNHCKLSVTLQELPLSLREAITFLRQGEGDINTLSEEVLNLVQQYQQENRIPVFSFPQNLSPNSTPPSQQQFCIGRGNRQYLQNIIENAQQFLLLSSYIIEDERLTELVCQKSQDLPQGVWILTDLRNEVLDRIDTQVITVDNLPEQYKRSDERKIRCIQQLLNANVRIRSGRFHLKTCISEKVAYLGSCNFTPGSLDFNLEAGVLCQNTSTHSSLIHLFSQFWQEKAKDEVIPTLNLNGFELHTVKSFSFHQFEKFPNLLTPKRYYSDLCQELQGFKGKVFILSRSFHPNTELERLLSAVQTQVVIDSEMYASSLFFKPKRVNNLHAKITLLGNKVAYIGGINFNFVKRYSSLNDLMYKTTFPEEIKKIQQALS